MTRTYYDLFSRFLHWAMAIVIIYATIAGYVMHLVIDDYPAVFHVLSVINMSMATLITPLFFIRWGWKYMRNAPPAPQVAHHKIAKLVHSLLYFMMFLVFVSGFLMLKESYSWFWLYQINNPVSSADINQFFFTLHRYSCVVLAGLVILHVSAALHHHWIKGNKILHRMIGPSANQ